MQIEEGLAHFQLEIRKPYSAIGGPTRYRVVVLTSLDRNKDVFNRDSQTEVCATLWTFQLRDRSY